MTPPAGDGADGAADAAGLRRAPRPHVARRRRSRARAARARAGRRAAAEVRRPSWSTGWRWPRASLVGLCLTGIFVRHHVHGRGRPLLAARAHRMRRRPAPARTHAGGPGRSGHRSPGAARRSAAASGADVVSLPPSATTAARPPTRLCAVEALLRPPPPPPRAGRRVASMPRARPVRASRSPPASLPRLPCPARAGAGPRGRPQSSGPATAASSATVVSSPTET